MEHVPDGAETETGPFAGLVELFVEDARRSVEKHETRQYRIDGCNAGLDRCMELRYLDAQGFREELFSMQQVTSDMKERAIDSDQAQEDYWHQRCATAQVEFCFEVLRVAHKVRFGELLDGDQQGLSARSSVRYNFLAMRLGLDLYGSK